MPSTPTSPVQAYEQSRHKAAWDRLCDARQKYKELVIAARKAKLEATMFSLEVQAAQTAWDEINRS